MHCIWISTSRKHICPNLKGDKLCKICKVILFELQWYWSQRLVEERHILCKVYMLANYSQLCMIPPKHYL